MSVLLSSCLSCWLLIFPAFLSAAPRLLTVGAAADLARLEPELQAASAKADPNVHVRFVTSASAILAQQIEHGAPYDVFLSANAEFVDRLTSEGKLLPGAVVYAKGRLGILWRDGKSHRIDELTQPWVHFVALANPKLAPYGVAAQQALEHAGLWRAVQPKVVYGENVRQALQMFDTGNADAVITSVSLLEGRHPDPVPAAWHQPIVQKAGIVSATANQDAARAFLHFLTSPAGHAVFAKFGFE